MLTDHKLLAFLGINTQGDLGPWTFYTSKRKGLVFFQKAPPLEPPSLKQIHQRNKFRMAGYVWRSLAPLQRENWQTAARRAGLQITGYNLFVYYLTKKDTPVVQTVERQSGVQLVPLVYQPP